MDVGDDPCDSRSPEPGHHDVRGLAGVSAPVVWGGHDPLHRGGDIARLVGHRGLHGADRAVVVESAHDPVEPSFGAIGGAARGLRLVALL